MGHVGHVHEVETEQGGENCHHSFDQVNDCEDGNEEKPLRQIENCHHSFDQVDDRENGNEEKPFTTKNKNN